MAGGKPSGDIIGAIDIGSSRIACVISATGRDGWVHLGGGARAASVATEIGGANDAILGVGYRRSSGIKSGLITNAALADASIASCVAQAEKMAGVSLSHVFIAITGGRLTSQRCIAHAALTSGRVTPGDLERVQAGARAYAQRDGRTLLHMNTLGLRLDNQPGGDDPIGITASKLSAQVHAVTADRAAITNLIDATQRCHLTVAGVVAAPYASALSVTSAQERRQGVSVIDMGAGTTSWAVFADDRLVACEAMATGGHHLTFEIAQILRAPLAEAERIKALWGHVVNARSNASDKFSYTGGEGSDLATKVASRADLEAIMRPRLEALFGSVGEKLRAQGVDRGAIVLTGGGSQLMGVAELASRLWECPVRLGRPSHPRNAGSHATVDLETPTLAAASGLRIVVTQASGLPPASRPPGGYLGRVGGWIGGSF